MKSSIEPAVTLIILNYNTPELVETLLNSIEKFQQKSPANFAQSATAFVVATVVVVDNGSADNGAAIRSIVKKFPLTEFIQLPKNIGFAAGNNMALRQVKTRYAMLLNSDTELTAETHLEKMIAYADEHPKVAVMTPKLLLSSGKLDFASHRGEPTPWASFTYFSKLEALFPKIPVFSQYHQLYKNLSEIHEIDACSGAAMLVRTTAMTEVGYLDEAFFMYAEDLDWCKRFRDAGYSIVYFPESVIIHHKYQSGRKNSETKLAKKTSQYFYDTMLQYYDKHYKTEYPSFIRFFIKLFIQLKKGAQ